MIIRSQDKRKTTTDLNLHIDSIEVGKENIKRVFIKSEKAGTIGVYSAEEKAIKVLDMIQNAYTQYGTIKNGLGSIHGAFNIPKYFQMPSDEEVEV